MTSRRQFVLWGTALALAGCAKPCAPPSAPNVVALATLIDAHCHLFNRQDLSAVRFLSTVIAGHYPDLEGELQKLAPSRPEDPKLIDQVFALILGFVGANSAPSAKRELAVLKNAALRGPADAGLGERRNTAIARVADFFEVPSPSTSPPPADTALRTLIQQAAFEAGLLAPDKAPDAAERTRIARLVVTGEGEQEPLMAGLDGFYLPGLFNFALQLTRYRHCITDELTKLHRGAGQEPLLLTPAIVDFGRWLREDPGKGSSFRDQVEVWGEISRRPGGPAIHGYVAFCPLRQVEFDRARFAPKGPIKTACNDDPLEVVELALSQGGFLGVKLYPPMGFAAAHNEELAREGVLRAPVGVLDDVFGGDNSLRQGPGSIELGKLLDGALKRLYALCRKYGAPIMAHGGNSIEANCDTGEFADPYYWRDVVQGEKAPGVMLAHMGGFNYRSNDPDAPGFVSAKTCGDRPAGVVPLELTWEAWLARYVDQTGGQKPLYGDISMFTEALKTSTAQAAVAKFKALAGKHPMLKRHLVFGTDWLMLAQEKHVEQYSRRVREAVAAAFGDDSVEAIMRDNFLRFAQLSRTGPAFDRISTVYNGDKGLIGRLTAALPARPPQDSAAS